MCECSGRSKHHDEMCNKVVTLNLPVWIVRWIASFNSIPSNTVSADTPIAKIRLPIDSNPPGTCLCHKDAMVRMGPEKNPNPNSGRTIRKRSPIGFEKSPGQISPKPTLRNMKYEFRCKTCHKRVPKIENQPNLRCQRHDGTVESIYQRSSSSIGGDKTRYCIETNHPQNN